MASGAVLFKEKLQLPRKVYWFVMSIVIGGVFAVAGVFGYGIYRQLILKQPWGTSPVSDGTLIGLSITITLTMLMLDVPLIYLLLNARQSVRLTANKLTLEAPLGGRNLAIADIESWEMKPTRSYGLQYRLGGGWHINFGGRHSVRLKTRNGRLSIGTSQPQAFDAALRKARGLETDA